METKESGLVESNLLEIRPQRTVAGPEFVKGVQDYSWTVGGTWAFIPNRCYFRFGITLEAAAGGDPDLPIANPVALADNVCGNLYNNAYFRAGNQDVSSIVSYLPQASQLKNRLTKSRAWTQSLGKSAYGQDPSFASRAQQTAAHGKEPGSKLEILLGVGATAAMAQDSTAVTLTGATNFAQVEAGDILVISGQRFEIDTPPSDATGTGMTTVMESVAAIGATAQCYVIKNRQTPRRKTQYVMWCPPIGIFDSARPMGSGDYRVSLNPNSNYKLACCQALTSLTSGTDFDVTINDISFFVYLTRVSIPATLTEKLELTEIAIQTKPATSSTSNVVEFSVPPSTWALAVFVQGSSAGSDTALPPSLFKCTDKSDEKLRNIQITYANVSKPATNWTSDYSATDQYLNQRYLDTMAENGLAFNEGGCGETLTEWVERGPYIMYSFLRDRQDKSTHVQLQLTHTALQSNANIMLAALYRRVAQVSTQSGRVVQVSTLSV